MCEVAIGMPVWNGEAFLSQAIEPILAQTYGDFALAISDNASSVEPTPSWTSVYIIFDRKRTSVLPVIT